MREQFSAADMATAAADGFRAGHDNFRGATKMVGHWYMVDKDGMATLCADQEDAKQAARDAAMVYPRSGPHRAVQLVDASEMAKLKGQRSVLCDLLRECLTMITVLLAIPGDDESDEHLNGLSARIHDALVVIAEEQVKRRKA